MNVNKDQGDKDVDGPLLGPPEAQLKTEKRNLIEFFDKQNAKPNDTVNQILSKMPSRRRLAFQ